MSDLPKTVVQPSGEEVVADPPDPTSGSAGPPLASTMLETPAARTTGELPSARHRLGTVIDGRYRLEQLLGEGGMGAVYRATHVLMDKPVAVKLIHAELAHLPEVAARFEREARSASRLNHPNCILVTDFGRTADGTLYLVMELLAGESLASRLERQGPLPLGTVVRLLGQIVSALAQAHAAGIVHRDLKPENVMLAEVAQENDVVKILDFGIAKMLHGEREGEKLTRSGVVFGTPPYLSPEQALGDPVDHRADLYACGVMLFEMLVGRVPFDAESAMDIMQMHLTSPVPRLAEAGEFPAAVQEIIDRAMAKRPADRYADAEELLAALAALDPTATIRLRRSGPLPRPIEVRLRRLERALQRRLRRTVPRSWVLAGLLATLLLPLGLILAVTLGTGAEPPETRLSAPVIEAVRRNETPRAAVDTRLAALTRGEDQLRRGLASEAVITARELLKMTPDDPPALLLLGSALFASGDMTGGLAAYAATLAGDPRLAGDLRFGENLKRAFARPDAQAEAARLLAALPDGSGGVFLAGIANSEAKIGTDRRAAREALIAAGRGQDVDLYRSLKADLREAKDCKTRKELFTAMAETGDRRFVELIQPWLPREVRRGLFRREVRNECEGPAARKALKTLEDAPVKAP